MKRLHTISALLVAVAWIASATGAGIAVGAPSTVAQAKISITARGGYGDDGSYLIGKWFPVRVTLTNPAGGTSRRVRVEIDSQGDSANVVTGIYVREVDMPAPSRKEVTLYVTAANFARNMEVRLMAGSTQIDKTTVNLDPLEQATNIIIGVVSPDPALLNVLKGERFGHAENSLVQMGYPGYLPPVPTTAPASGSTSTSSSPARAAIAHMALEDIPTISEALDGMGALALDDIDTGSLQVDQRQALADWVARGGTLITAVKPGGEGVLVGVSEMSPVEINGTQNLIGLDRLAGWISVPLTITGSTLVPAATVKEDARSMVRVPVSQEGVPLVAIREVDRGQVIYMALSPGLAPLKNWDGLLPLFRRLLVEHRLRISDVAGSPPGYYGYYQSKVFDTYGTIFDLPGLDLPSPMLIGLFLFIYIVVVGPINFIILRRMRRTELAWATIPALVALFSIIAYLLAFQSKGGDLVALRANVVETGTGLARGSATQYLGLFSPTRGTYRLEGGTPALVSEINSYGYGGSSNGSPLRFTSDGSTTVEEIKINTWSLRGFQSTSMIDAESPLLAVLRVGDNVIEGTLRNRSVHPLQDVVLIRGDALQHFTSIGPGQSIDVKLKISSRPFNYNSPTVLMPPPPGVSDPSSQGGGFGYNNSSDSDAQRAYNRKVEVLNMALSPVLSADPPDSLDVLAVMWGPPSGSTLEITNAAARNDDLNLWLSRFTVAGQNDTGSQPQLSTGTVPFTMYAPGNGADWISGPPTAEPRLTLKPYADITYRLPPGTRPAELAFNYQATGFTGEVEVLAQNVSTGVWERVGSLMNQEPSSNGTKDVALAIPNPSTFTGPGGDVTLRLNSLSGEQSGSLSTRDLILNGGR